MNEEALARVGPQRHKKNLLQECQFLDMLSRIKTEICFYWFNVLTANILPAFIAVKYFIHGVRFKGFYFLFENFPCYFPSFCIFFLWPWEP